MKNNSQLSERSIKRLSKKAWQGLDANLETSLFDYDMVWKEKKDEFEFIHLCSHGKGYSSSHFKKNLDFAKEFSWVNWKEFLSSTGYETFEEWNKMGLPVKLHDLKCYYGMENIFGSDYYEGFYVKFI